uniref:Uncharacterized protein n=1 Tax=Panagrolaimus sp. ES5 TaxID=591445 RepID=A0AC34EZU8_9BILA
MYLLPTLFVKSVILGVAPVEIKLTRDTSFTVVLISKKSPYIFQIQDIKGNIEIQKICHPDVRVGTSLPYNRNNKTFSCNYLNSKFYEFHIMADINYTPVNFVDINYHLHISAALLQPLRAFQCLEKDIILPGYETLVFKCFIKKVKSNAVEIHVRNPYNIIINGKTTDFQEQVPTAADINMDLCFVFDPVALGSGNPQNASAPPEYDEVFQDHVFETPSIQLQL